MSSVFAQLNQGESVTKGLRHVDKSEMTHKNPELRTAGVVPTSCECSTVSLCVTWTSPLTLGCGSEPFGSFVLRSAEATQAECDAEEACQEGA